MLVGLTLLWCEETLQELKIENGLVVGEIGDVFVLCFLVLFIFDSETLFFIIGELLERPVPHCQGVPGRYWRSSVPFGDGFRSTRWIWGTANYYFVKSRWWKRKRVRWRS